jgi:hypothetical protein
LTVFEALTVQPGRTLPVEAGAQEAEIVPEIELLFVAVIVAVPVELHVAVPTEAVAKLTIAVLFDVQVQPEQLAPVLFPRAVREKFPPFVPPVVFGGELFAWAQLAVAGSLIHSLVSLVGPLSVNVTVFWLVGVVAPLTVAARVGEPELAFAVTLSTFPEGDKVRPVGCVKAAWTAVAPLPALKVALVASHPADTFWLNESV